MMVGSWEDGGGWKVVLVVCQSREELCLCDNVWGEMVVVWWDGLVVVGCARTDYEGDYDDNDDGRRKTGRTLFICLPAHF